MRDASALGAAPAATRLDGAGIDLCVLACGADGGGITPIDARDSGDAAGADLDGE